MAKAAPLAKYVNESEPRKNPKEGPIEQNGQVAQGKALDPKEIGDRDQT